MSFLTLSHADELGYTIHDILTASSPTHSRSKEWKPGAGIPLEIGGMDWTADGRLAVALRKGEVWLLGNVLSGDPDKVTYHEFASGLHEPLGLLRDGGDLLVTQRTELTRLRDTDGDSVADAYLTETRGWNVSGSYHGYAYGPQRDGQGNLWLALNLDMGDHSDNAVGFRGWAGTAAADGTFTPLAAGMRSPCGLGANTHGDMFCVDQQGNWIPTTPIYHLQPGAFYLNPDGLGPTFKLSGKLPDKLPYPEAVATVPEMVPPAVWLPYNKVGRSGTDLAVCDQAGKFGPFDGQFFVAEFTDAKVSRVFLEKVDGHYQGAAFPFLSGFASGIVRLRFAPDGSLMVGMTSRGWSSLGTRAYGLQRVTFDPASAPFAIKEMRAKPDGFQLTFTQPVDPATATDPASYSISSYTYRYSNAYGSPEINTQANPVTAVGLSPDGLTVHLTVGDLRPLHVHELHAPHITTPTGQKLAHPHAYYTLNRIPKAP